MVKINFLMKAQRSKCLLIALCLLLSTPLAFARDAYQSAEDFLAISFADDVPASKVVWLRGDVRKAVTEILGHPYAGLRIRYWQEDAKTAWVLEEIGKVEPITFGLVIEAGKIAQIKVLTYREHRGMEIRFDAFTQQFKGAMLRDKTLDRTIDGISGATLSVRAMRKVAQLGLYLHGSITTPH